MAPTWALVTTVIVLLVGIPLGLVAALRCARWVVERFYG